MYILHFLCWKLAIFFERIAVARNFYVIIIDFDDWFHQLRGWEAASKVLNKVLQFRKRNIFQSLLLHFYSLGLFQKSFKHLSKSMHYFFWFRVIVDNIFLQKSLLTFPTILLTQFSFLDYIFIISPKDSIFFSLFLSIKSDSINKYYISTCFISL